ncbi:protein tapetum determinant 1 [Nicotiana attenuata]|uniref:Protein tapetum determinant 1 n=1 Tax=Nicotiana attenuata TaxID=49451 RepID=A0A314KW57_NICAT|nr:protein tapetum determinant 1 [Nicotiana attenuata]
MSHILNFFFCFFFVMNIIIGCNSEFYLSDKSGNRKDLLDAEVCTGKDISIYHSRSSNEHGIPEYIVEIVNTCSTNCAASNIHLNCGSFASAKLVNPTIFKRLYFNDCLVNGGKPLKVGKIIRFTYSNTYMYPLSLKSAKFC